MGVRRPPSHAHAEDAPQREHALRDVFHALRWLVKTGGQRRYLAGDFPPWQIVYQQARRLSRRRSLRSIVYDVREFLRLVGDRNANLRGDERLTTTLAGWHWSAFATLILRRIMNLMADSA